jgi:hypothetical protein
MTEFRSLCFLPIFQLPILHLFLTLSQIQKPERMLSALVKLKSEKLGAVKKHFPGLSVFISLMLNSCM